MMTQAQVTHEAAASTAEQFNVVVVGGGQAGLAMGYHLRQLAADIPLNFIILDAHDQIGGAWANRWDSLTLFTPAAYTNLPGFPFPADDPLHLPHRDEVIAYLQEYARLFELPVRLNTRVNEIRRIAGKQYALDTSSGQIIASQVVVATGAFQTPRIPPLAAELSPDIVHFHSSRYRSPDQLPAGDVLVVGAGNSGAQIALELAQRGGKVYLSGRDVGSLPRTFLGRDIYWWLYKLGIATARRDSFIGRRLTERIMKQGGALIGISNEQIEAAEIMRVPKLVGVRGGLPVLADGFMPAVSSIIWCTGYQPDFGWIKGLKRDEFGYPVHKRGVALNGEPGLYFLGLLFLYRVDSALLNGVGEDARFVAKAIRKRLGAKTTAPAS